MSRCNRRLLVGLTLLVASQTIVSGLAAAKPPTIEQALALKPLQADVDYETPSGDELAKCSIQAASAPGASGWLVYNGSGQLLRRYLDTNGDNKVDQWCYYKNGIEVYRDVDSNFNGKADQYRWLGTAGTRWGLDNDEDGRIDRWKAISAEELAAEVTAALRDRDERRFQRLLLATDELRALGLGDVQTRDIAKKVTTASQGFAELAQRQTVVGSKSEWVSFGAGHPCVVPAGYEGAKRDVVIYDSASSIVSSDGKHAQISLGTLIQTEGGWRLFDLPQNLLESQTVAGGYFFQEPSIRQPDAGAPTEGLTEAEKKLVTELEQIDKALASATSPEQVARGNAARADVLEQLSQQASRPENRESYLRQFADSVSAAVQSGGYAEGVGRLKKLADKLTADPANEKLAPHVTWCYLTADYARSLAQAKADDYPKIQEKWMADVRTFVDTFPRSEDAAEAMLQLAVGCEFAGKADDAVTWYGKIIQLAPSAEIAKKAAGARRRLEGVGKLLDLTGPTLDGKPVSLSAYRGRIVLVQYWATWCQPCKQDMATLNQLYAKYAKQGFNIVGVNLDNDRTTAVNYLQANPLAWPQLYEAGGLDSRLAQELGIITLPTMILVDREGKVLNRNIHASELDEELGKRLR
jgi:thiol-disulfide isomerase/thioredoxin